MRIPRFLPLLVWISPKAYPDTMIQVQIVYLGVGDLSGEFGQERGKDRKVCVYKRVTAVAPWACLPQTL